MEDGQVTALVIYGDITSDRLREVNMTRLDTLKHRDIISRKESPPTRKEAAAAAKKRLLFTAIPVIGPDGEHLVRMKLYRGHDVAGFIQFQATRRHGEPEDDYLRRFAHAWLEVGAVVDSPHAAMADALGYSPNTVKSYILKCRQRGFLPPSRRSTR
jgi:hypothetical protein